MSNLKRLLAIGLIVSILVLAVGIAALATSVETATSSSFGLRARVTIGGTLSVRIPKTPSAVTPNSEASNNVVKTILGPIRAPANGQLISDISVLKAIAQRTLIGLPTAHAEGQVAHAALLEQNGKPQIELDAVHAVASASCTGVNKATANADGSHFVNLILGGQPIDATPPANTKIPLVYTGDATNPDDDMGVLVILNEQTGAADGTGIRVTMLHIILFSPKTPNIVFGDIQIGEAQASVFCGPATPSTGTGNTDRNVTSDKVATNKTNDLGIDVASGGAKAHRGDTVAWVVTITNKGTLGCDVTSVTDRVPSHFTFVKSSGDLTTVVEPTQDGQELTWDNGQRYSLPANGKLIETVTATVDKDAPFGTYANLVDVNESTCSSFTQGLRGPVEVVSAAAAAIAPVPVVKGAKFKLPTTGVPLSALAVAVLALTSLGFAAREYGKR